MRIPQVHALTRHYVNRFGLSLRPFVQSNPRAFYYLRGQRVRIEDQARINRYFKLAAGERRQSPADFWARTVLGVLEQLTGAEKDELASASVVSSDKLKALDQLSLKAVFKQHGLSPEAAEMLGTAWAYETSLDTGITEILREEINEVWNLDFHEIVGGMDLLPRAFAARLRGKPRMGARVTRIEQDGRRARVIYEQQGHTHAAEGDAVLCTLPLGVLSHIEVGPSGPKWRAIRQVTYDSSTKVLVRTRKRFWETDEGIFGGGTYTDLPTGMTFYPSDNAQLQDPSVSKGAGVMLASYTWGQPARRLAALSSRARATATLSAVAKFHPQILAPGAVDSVISFCWDTNPYSKGAFCWYSPGQLEELHPQLVAPEGRLFLAGEHASLAHTWIQGALESARAAVRRILTARL